MHLYNSIENSMLEFIKITLYFKIDINIYNYNFQFKIFEWLLLLVKLI